MDWRCSYFIHVYNFSSSFWPIIKTLKLQMVSRKAQKSKTGRSQGPIYKPALTPSVLLLIPEVQLHPWSARRPPCAAATARRRFIPPPSHQPLRSSISEHLCPSRRHPPNARARAPAAKAMALAPRRSRSCTTGCRSGWRPSPDLISRAPHHQRCRRQDPRPRILLPQSPGKLLFRSSASFCCRESSSFQRRGRLPSTTSPSCISPPTQIDISTEVHHTSFLPRFPDLRTQRVRRFDPPKPCPVVEGQAGALPRARGCRRRNGQHGRCRALGPLNYAFLKRIKGEEHRVNVFFCTKSICFKGELNVVNSEINLVG